ncbi:MAG: phosphatase PAP2 family protein [Tannerella sp.]|jgi:undecaprenyl-diphosphatase|nr:phosphatase PAP2 family protein [Tannerella sp.]
MAEQLLDYERNIFYAINGYHTRWLDGVMSAFTTAWIWFPMLLVPLLYLFRRKRYEWLSMLVCTGLTVAGSAVITDLIFKPLFKRFRPTSHPDFMENVTKVHDFMANGAYGFISGHSTNSFAFAMLTTLIIKRWWYTLLIFMWATLMAYSRIYMGVHFITDVIPGMIFGMLMGWGLYLVFKWLKRKYTPAI